MSRPHKLLCPKIDPDRPNKASTTFPFSGFEVSSSHNDDRASHRIARTKRKHVLKACERCRVKKSKCDGNQPCNRCLTYNHACIFRDRKASQDKFYSKGFVEMLISQHSIHLLALEELYRRCVNKEGLPGEPLRGSSYDHPGTHKILDQLGLIKHAEKAIEDPQAILSEINDYLKSLETATECIDSTESADPSESTLSGDPSPEPSTPRDVSEPSDMSLSENHLVWATSQAMTGFYSGYNSSGSLQPHHANMMAAMSGLPHQGELLHSRLDENAFPHLFRYDFDDIACQRQGPPANFPWSAPYHDSENTIGLNMSANGGRVSSLEEHGFSGSIPYHDIGWTNSSQ